MPRSSVPVTDPSRQNMVLREDLEQAFSRVLSSGQYVLGSQVALFESEFANYLGAKRVVGVANATDALTLALRALGIGAGDEVVTTPLTASATILGIANSGATPVLADISPETLNLDPQAVSKVIGPRTRAIVPVHLYGNPVDLKTLLELCDRNDLHLIEDSSQAHGATSRTQRIGTFGTAAIFSFYPTKNLGALGDGGAIATSDEALADRLLQLRQYGWKERNRSYLQGSNSRLDELQAAILRVKLPHLDHLNAIRRNIAIQYDSVCQDVGLRTVARRDEAVSSFHLYVALPESRSRFQQVLRELGIDTAVHYPFLPDEQPALARLCRGIGETPNAHRACMRVVSVPLFPELTGEEVDRVIQALARAGCD